MAHEITRRSNGQYEMAYVGAKPWHGLGQGLRPGAPIEEWLTAAGMDWKVQRSKVRYATGHGQDGAELAEWPDYHVLMRSDTKKPLGMVSDRFKIYQPREVLEFFRDLVEMAGFRLTTAGTLYEGKKYWAQASIGMEDRIVGKDLVKGHLLAATACDGSMNTVFKNVAERVVCANTIQIAFKEGGAPEVLVSHRSTVNEDEVKKTLGIATDSFTKFIHNARELAAHKVGGEMAERFIATLAEVKEEENPFENRAFNKILALFNGEGRGATLSGVQGTLWGLVNAVTEYHDHHRRAHSDSGKLNHAWFGGGVGKKQQAMEMALALIK